MLRNYLLRSAAVFAAPGEDGNGGNPPVVDGADAAAGEGSEAQGDAGGEGGAAAAGESSGDQGGAGAGAPPAAGANTQSKEDWRDKELRRKHAQNQEMKRQLDERNQELESLRAIAARTGGAAGDGAAGAGDGASAPAAAPQRTDAPSAGQGDIRQQALAQVRFEEAANAADRAGRERYKDDWKAATDNLALIGGFDPDTMNGILATDDPAKVLYELGKNPDRYSEIMALPPAKRQTEMVKMGMAAPVVRKEPSSAPPPPDHIGGRPRVDSDALRDDMTDEDWYSRRQRQKAARHAAKQAGR